MGAPLLSAWPRPVTSAGPLRLDRRRWLGWGAAALAGGGLGGCATRPPAPSPGLVPARLPASPVRFSDAVAGPDGLPPGWRLHVTRPDLPITGYALDVLEGRTVLHARGERSTSGVRCDLDTEIAATPWLSWDWRVDRFPERATAAVDELDDSPARLVLGFDGDPDRVPLRDRLFADQVELFTHQVLPYATLCYQWDGQAPVGQVLPYIRSTRIRYLVVQSGSAGLGRFTRHQRNVVEDFQQVFGEPPGRLISIGMMSDSDDLKGPVEAWYGDLVLSGSAAG